MNLNGGMKVGLHWLGAFIVGAATVGGVLWEVRKSEIADIERLAAERTVLINELARSARVVSRLDAQVQWIVRVNTMIAQKVGLRPSDLPPEPQVNGETWQGGGKSPPLPGVKFKDLLKAIDLDHRDVSLKGGPQ